VQCCTAVEPPRVQALKVIRWHGQFQLLITTLVARSAKNSEVFPPSAQAMAVDRLSTGLTCPCYWGNLRMLEVTEGRSTFRALTKSFCHDR
jgi:hypothetical protein